MNEKISFTVPMGGNPFSKILSVAGQRTRILDMDLLILRSDS